MKLPSTTQRPVRGATLLFDELLHTTTRRCARSPGRRRCSGSHTLFKFQSLGWRLGFSHGSHTPNRGVGEAAATLPCTRSSRASLSASAFEVRVGEPGTSNEPSDDSSKAARAACYRVPETCRSARAEATPQDLLCLFAVLVTGK